MSSSDDFNMKAHTTDMEYVAKKMKNDREFSARHSEEENEYIRRSYFRKAATAKEIVALQKNSPKPTLLARAGYWVGQLVPRTHWTVYRGDGGYRLAIWKSWLGRRTSLIDVKVG